MRPPVTPVALDYLAAALDDAGFPVEVIDLAFADDPVAALVEGLGRSLPLLIGVSIRNIDDAHCASRLFCLPAHRKIIHTIRKHCLAPIVLGGAGFSIMPQLAMDYCGANLGIVGPGERAIVQLAQRIRDGETADGIPGIMFRRTDTRSLTIPAAVPMHDLPLHRRRWVDNLRYWREGGQVGFETKRGCSHQCIYCVEAGSARFGIQLRRPTSVVRELSGLLDQGVRDFHTCDSEFNVPADHAAAVCNAIRDAGLQRRIRWYAYCTPAGFSTDLAARMAAAGCAGVNFGVDHTDSAMLEKLRRGFTGEQALAAIRAAKEVGMAVMADLLLGAPGETPASLARVIGRIKESDVDAVGVAMGVRVYPNTQLARNLKMDPRKLVAPTFYLDPAIGEMGEAEGRITKLIDSDPRFFFGKREPTADNYNYSDNEVLVDAIRNGARGAYWHILTKLISRR